MRLAVHVAKLAYDALAYSLSSRRWSVAVVVLLGLVLVALVLAAQTAAPLALYPFA